MMNSGPEGVPPAVRIRGLVVVRGVRTVLDHLDLDIAAGTLTGLLGPSGSGKSTLMRSIIGVQKIAGGTVEVLGELGGSASLRARVAYYTQAPSVYDDLTVRENLRYFADVLGTGRTDVDRVIDEVDLTSHAEHVVGRLSGGQRSRVSLAVALLGRPELLVLDEPTVGLDPVLRRDLWKLFHQLVDGGRTVIVSSHVMDEAERCDRLVLLRDGEILADDTLPGLLDATGAANAEGAFLRLIDDRNAAEGRGTT